MPIERRKFIGLFTTLALHTGVSQTSPETPIPDWGGKVIDCHFHLRKEAAANRRHLDGCGVSQALLLANVRASEEVAALRSREQNRFPGWAASTDITKPDAEQLLTSAVKKGATGLGELKSHVAANSPELRRMYALAADLNVPILIHFQEVPHTPAEGVFSIGFQKDFESILKSFPGTRFVGHADAFWANISADYRNQAAYPTGPIKPGGVTDRLLANYPNIFGDLSANSGNNALSRDAEFTREFLRRHQDKLIFGSDCGCSDGNGGGISQANNPVANRLAGKCVARETLTLLKRSASPEIFHKLTWLNGHRVYGLPTPQ